MLVFRVLLLLAAVGIVLCAECHGKPDPDAKPNLNQIYTEQPKFISQVKNAKLFSVGSGEDIISIVHLYGK
jgi:isopenicillin-N N-acyltransferase like protein